MDQGNRVAVIMDRGNHVPVIYVDTVDLVQMVGSSKKPLRLCAFARKVGFDSFLMKPMVT
jgi:hypothetical protein